MIDERFANRRRAGRLLDRTSRFLAKLDPALNRPFPAAPALTVRHDCIGDGYGRFTPEGVKAAELMEREAGIVLNGAYSAKAFSALVQDARRRAIQGKTVLFWNTSNSRDLSPFTSGIDYHDLPQPLHRYFQEEVQPLDCEQPLGRISSEDNHGWTQGRKSEILNPKPETNSNGGGK